MATLTQKSLERKIRGLEKKCENTNPKAVLKLAGIERIAGKYQKRLGKMTGSDVV